MQFATRAKNEKTLFDIDRAVFVRFRSLCFQIHLLLRSLAKGHHWSNSHEVTEWSWVAPTLFHANLENDSTTASVILAAMLLNPQPYASFMTQRSIISTIRLILPA